MAFLVSTLRRSGPTAVILNILRHLDRGRFDPVVVTLSPEPAESMSDAVRETGTAVGSLSMSRVEAQLRRRLEGAIRRLSRIAPDGRCIVHSHGLRADVISSTQLGKLARVTTAHNDPYQDYPMKYGQLVGRYMAWRHLRAFRALPVVVACSSALSETLRFHGIGARVIRNGVDTAKFRPAAPDEKARLRAELSLPADARIAVSVGTLSRRKDPLRVIRAVRSIDDPGLLLLLAGGGDSDAQCRRAAAGDDRIRMVGPVADPAPFVRAADCFVSASRSEGLPVAALEAIACGLPVILSDIGPHRELLGLSAAAELFPVGDEAALAQALRRGAARAAAGRDDAGPAVFAGLGAEQMSRSYQQLYQGLADDVVRPH